MILLTGMLGWLNEMRSASVFRGCGILSHGIHVMRVSLMMVMFQCN